jgi:hypothetical protein
MGASLRCSCEVNPCLEVLSSQNAAMGLPAQQAAPSQPCRGSPLQRTLPTPFGAPPEPLHTRHIVLLGTWASSHGEADVLRARKPAGTSKAPSHLALCPAQCQSTTNYTLAAYNCICRRACCIFSVVGAGLLRSIFLGLWTILELGGQTKNIASQGVLGSP